MSSKLWFLKTTIRFPDDNVPVGVRVYEWYVMKRLPVVFFQFRLLSLAAESLCGCGSNVTDAVSSCVGCVLRWNQETSISPPNGTVTVALSDQVCHPKAGTLVLSTPPSSLRNWCSWWDVHQTPKQHTQRRSHDSGSALESHHINTRTLFAVGEISHLSAADMILHLFLTCFFFVFFF